MGSGSVLTSACDALIRLLLTPACASCREPLSHPLAGAVCVRCWGAVTRVRLPWCVRCGDELPLERAALPHCRRCRRRPPRFALARSAGRYDGRLRDIIHVFKYDRRRVLAEPLGAMMREAGGDLLAGADAVVPVPLHALRALERGFNQADDLARQLGLPVWRVLRRRRHGPPQASLPAGRRHANLRNAYGLSARGYVAARRGQIRNRVFVLIDDVMTTGATMDACARVLIASGARVVHALTAARTAARSLPPPRERRDPSAVHRQ